MNRLGGVAEKRLEDGKGEVRVAEFRDDPDRWPDAVSLPPNVHLFSKRQVETTIYRRNSLPIATLIGRSSDGRESIRGAEYRHEPDNTIACASERDQ